jgi:hypothetical protein
MIFLIFYFKDSEKISRQFKSDIWWNGLNN